MAKDDLIPAEGTIIDKQPNAFFKVRVDNSEHVVLAGISGRMRRHRIRILVGDRVSVEMSPYDLLGAGLRTDTNKSCDHQQQHVYLRSAEQSHLKMWTTASETSDAKSEILK